MAHIPLKTKARHFCEVISDSISKETNNQLSYTLFREPLPQIPHFYGSSIDYKIHPTLFKIQVQYPGDGRFNDDVNGLTLKSIDDVGFYPGSGYVYELNFAFRFMKEIKERFTPVLNIDSSILSESITFPPCASMTFTLYWPFPTQKDAARMQNKPEGTISAVFDKKGNPTPVTIKRLIEKVHSQMNKCVSELTTVSEKLSYSNIVHGFHSPKYLLDPANTPPEVIAKLGGKPILNWSWIHTENGFGRRLFSRIDVKNSTVVGGYPSAHFDFFFHVEVIKVKGV